MPRRPREILEYRNHTLPPEFPILVLTGDEWRISDVRVPALHFHNCLEIGLCHSDSGVLEFQDTSYHFKAGDLTLIGSEMPHTTYSSPGTASRWSYLFVDPAQLLDPPVSSTDILPAELYKNIMRNSRLIISEEQDPVPTLLAKEVIREMRSMRVNYRRCVASLLDALLSKLSRYTAETGSPNTDAPFPIAPALRHIDEHYMDNFKMDDLAALCKMSTSYFRRVFTETMGSGPLEYLNQKRISRACNLLRITDLSILEVCEAVGFCSLSSFNRHFSTIMGQPPTSWRHSINADRPYTVRRYAGYTVPPKIEPHRTNNG